MCKLCEHNQTVKAAKQNVIAEYLERDRVIRYVDCYDSEHVITGSANRVRLDHELMEIDHKFMNPPCIRHSGCEYDAWRKLEVKR